MRSRPIHFVALGLALVVISASAEPSRADPDCPATRWSDQIELSLSVRDDNEQLIDADVRLSEARSLYLEYHGERTSWYRTPVRPQAQVHHLTLARLQPESGYEVRAFTLDLDGCPAAVAAAMATTGALPAQLRRLKLEQTSRAPFPLSLMDLRLTNTTLRWLAIFDEAGEVVWHFPLSRDTLGRDPGKHGWGVIRLANGNFLALPGQANQAVIISPGATVVQDIRLPDESINSIHHDALELPDQQILFITSERRLLSQTNDPASGGDKIRTDSLYRFDPLSGAAEKVWDAFEALDMLNNPPPDHGGPDADDDDWPNWNHTNSISLGPRGNIVLSMRAMDQVVSLSPDLKSVEWRLGGPGSTLSLNEPDARFYHQHAVIPLSETRLLMFDNGNYRPDGQFSRALELELNLTAGSARRVWEYRASPDILSDRISNAFRLPNGNTVVNFGFRADDPTAPIVAVEVRPDGSTAWEQLMSHPNGRISRYRLLPLESIAGEQPTSPTAVMPRVD